MGVAELVDDTGSDADDVHDCSTAIGIEHTGHAPADFGRAELAKFSKLKNL